MMMIRRAYLVLLLISSSSSIQEEYVVVTAAAASTSSRVLNVGALVSLDSTIGRVARVAMEAAVAHVNRDPAVLPSTTLHLSVQDTNYTGFVGMVQGVSLLEKRTVAIIGPQYSVTAHVISQLANELQVPLLSFSATDPTLSSLQYPFFVRATRSDAFQMAAIADMVDYFGWRELIAVYVDDDHGRNGIAALEDKLAERRCRISFRAPLNGGFTREDITDVLLKVALQESRIVVLLAYPEWGLQVLNTAQYLGMTATGYVWILTDWLSTLLDTDSPLPQEAMNSIRGVITLRIYSPDSPSKSKFVSHWSNLVSGGSNTSSLGLSTYGMYAYDTVWLLARAFDTFFDRGGEISFSPDPKLASEPAEGHFKADAVGVFDGGKLLLDSILNISMSGVTGQIKFNSDGNLIHPAYEIINVIGTGFRRIGYWSNHSGLTLVPPETLYSRPSNYSSSNQQLSSVIWPGQTTVKPRGWVFPNNGKHLTIGVPKQNIFPEFVSVRGNDMFTGFCIELFTSALNLLPYAVPYTFKASEDDHTELLQLMTAGIYDALVGDIAITTNRTKIADFTQPFIESGLVVVAPVRRLNSSAWAFLRPFSPSMWILIGVLFVVVGAVIWTLEHKVNDDFRGPPRRQIITILWFSFSTLFFAHRERTISGFGRLILIMWLFVVFILISSYTASLTSILTVEQLSSPVKGIESLVSSNGPIGLQRGSFAEDYLMEEYKIDKSRFVPLSSAEEYTKALRDGPSNGGVVAVVDERAYMELFLSTRCEFSIVGQEFSKLGWGFAFPRDSPLAVDMSTAILKLSEGGDLQRMHNKWLMRSACSYEGAKEEAERLQLKSFWGLFAVCGLACFLALLVHFVHMVKQFGELHTEDDDDLESSGPSKRLQRFLSFVGEKEEELIRRSKIRRMGRTSSRSIYGDDSIMVASFKSSASEA